MPLEDKKERDRERKNERKNEKVTEMNKELDKDRQIEYRQFDKKRGRVSMLGKTMNHTGKSYI